MTTASLARRRQTVRLNLDTLEARDVPSTTNLGIAQEFNAFVLNDLNVYNSDAEGRIAVGDDASLYNYGVGQGLTNSHGTRDDLVVGDDLTYTNGQVFNGNIYYGDTKTITNVSIPNGVAYNGNYFNFTAASADLNYKSEKWGAYVGSGKETSQWGGLYLEGSNPNLNIFTIDASQLNGIWGINVKAPSTSTVLINVHGTSAELKYLGINYDGVDPTKVLFNFPEAKSIKIEGVGINGSILAPKAEIKFNNGQINGTVVADSICGNGQFNLRNVNILIPESLPSSISGTVFTDWNKNGSIDPNEVGVSGVAVYLSGIPLPTFTDNKGNFTFVDVDPGSYTLATANDQGFSVVSLTPGSEGGTKNLPTGEIQNIGLGEGVDGVNYLFGLFIGSGNGTGE